MKQFPRSFQPALLALALLLIGGCEGFGETATLRANVTPSPTEVFVQAMPTPVTADAPTPTLISSPTPSATVSPPDPRIARYEAEYGVQFLYKDCAAPCRNIIGVIVLVEPVRLGDWVEKFGAPDKAIGYFRRGRLGDDIVADLYYVDKGLHLSASRAWAGRPEATTDMVIDQFDFLTARSLPEIAKEMRMLYGTSRELEQAVDWKGFGLIPVAGR